MRGWDVVQRNFARFRAGTGVPALARKFRVFKMLIGRWGREYNCSCSPDWEGADTAACAACAGTMQWRRRVEWYFVLWGWI